MLNLNEFCKADRDFIKGVYSEVKAFLASKGYQLSTSATLTFDKKGHREINGFILKASHVRCHFDRRVSWGWVTKFYTDLKKG